MFTQRSTPWLWVTLAVLLSACNSLTVTDDIRQGEAVFVQNGCASCHATTAETRVGPGLLGVLSGAGANGGKLPNGEAMTDENVTAWIREQAAASGGVMPAYPSLSEAEMRALMAYLKSLQ
jgi:cytochrome c oxidase subunit 2